MNVTTTIEIERDGIPIRVLLTGRCFDDGIDLHSATFVAGNGHEVFLFPEELLAAHEALARASQRMEDPEC